MKRKKAGRPRANINGYVTKIENYLLLGYSLKKSCVLGGVPYTTVNDYYNNNLSIRTKIDILKNSTSLQARANWVREIMQGSYKASKRWLELVEPEYFSKRKVSLGLKSSKIRQDKVRYVLN